MRRVLCLLVLVGLVALSSFSPVLAIGEPLFFGPFHFEGTSVLADCGTFQVLDRFSAELSITGFRDAEGNPDWALFDFFGTDTYINSVTGISYTEPFHNREIRDVDPDFFLRERTILGVIFRLTVPGGGAVLLDVGRLVISQGSLSFEAGPHQVVDSDFASLCAAMA